MVQQTHVAQGYGPLRGDGVISRRPNSPAADLVFLHSQPVSTELLLSASVVAYSHHSSVLLSGLDGLMLDYSAVCCFSEDWSLGFSFVLVSI